MRLCAILLAVSAPAAASKSAVFQVGARVIRSATIRPRASEGNVRVEQQGEAARRTQIERAPRGGFIVTVMY